MQSRRRWSFRNSTLRRASEFTDSVIVEKSLGPVQITAKVTAVPQGPDAVNGSLDVVTVKPKLPPGLTVSNCVGILLKISGTVAIQSLDFSLSVQEALAGHTAMGERLDAQEWSDGAHVLMVGTEDSEALDIRYPNLSLGETQIVHYTPNSMTLKLTNLPALYDPSFHYVIAENEEPEPVEASAWFAVDQDHTFLLSQ